MSLSWSDNQDASQMDTVVGVSDGLNSSAPLVLCGMHRSGTSLTASLLATAGLHLGEDLLAASSGNQRGHFEDLEILTFHRNVPVANGLLSEGYTTQHHTVIPERLRQQAAALVAARSNREQTWGWKEPRTTLFLDFWRELVPSARFLLVFRRPWEVVDSLLRRNEAMFHWNPAFAIEVWLHYNQQFLDFAQRHPDETMVCELTQVIAGPHAIFDSLNHRWGLSLAEPSACYEPRLLRQDVTSSQAALLAVASPHAYELYLKLRELAGSDSLLPVVPDPESHPHELGLHVFTTWGQATQHMLRCHEAEAELERQRIQSARPRRRWQRLLSRGRNFWKAA